MSKFLIFLTIISIDPDDVPETTESFQQIITPSKDSTTTIEGPHFSLTIRKPIAVVKHLLPSTPHKELSAAPDIQSEKTESLKSLKRGENIDDDIKLEFLKAWIQFSEVPFGFCISQHKSSKAKNTIEQLMRYEKNAKICITIYIIFFQQSNLHSQREYKALW